MPGPYRQVCDCTRPRRQRRLWILPFRSTGVLATDGLADKLTCQHCGRKFKRGCGRAQHLKSCSKRPLPHSNPDLVCSDCQRVFQRPCGLAQHRKTCPNRQATSADDTSGNTEVVCPKCQRRFKRPCGLGRHGKSCAGGQEQPPLDASASEDRDEGQHLINCPDCPRTFKRPSGLASRRRAHHRTQREDAPNSGEVILIGPSLQSPNITTEAC